LTSASPGEREQRIQRQSGLSPAACKASAPRWRAKSGSPTGATVATVERAAQHDDDEARIARRRARPARNGGGEEQAGGAGQRLATGESSPR